MKIFYIKTANFLESKNGHFVRIKFLKCNKDCRVTAYTKCFIFREEPLQNFPTNLLKCNTNSLSDEC